MVVQGASGFLYYVAVAGVTGANSAVAGDVGAAVARIRAVTDLPVAVGFGVRTPAQAAEIAVHADAVVVGSAIVELIAAAHAARANDLPEQVQRFVRGLSDAVRGATRRDAA
jgi:tryptophan synthase alpha chain